MFMIISLYNVTLSLKVLFTNFARLNWEFQIGHEFIIDAISLLQTRNEKKSRKNIAFCFYHENNFRLLRTLCRLVVIFCSASNHGPWTKMLGIKNTNRTCSFWYPTTLRLYSLCKSNTKKSWNNKAVFQKYIVSKTIFTVDSRSCSKYE